MRADSKPPVPIADDTELLLGMRGKFDGEPFALVGRAHVESKTGGHWNEWRAVFENGKEGWLAEAATRFYFMFEGPILDVEHASPGSVASARYTIVERNEATRTQTWGDVEPADGFVFRYVDLSSDDGRVATMDFTGEHPVSFLGRKVTLEELGLLAAREPQYIPIHEGIEPDSQFAVGGTISLQNTSFKILATMARSQKDDDDRFSWCEHLLYKQGKPLMWLVELPDEYRIVSLIEPGAVDVRDGSVRYGGDTWKKSQATVARLDGARGMVPWKARVGEEVTATDYEKKERMLSVEQTDREVVWSLSVPLDEPDLVYAPPESA